MGRDRIVDIVVVGLAGLLTVIDVVTPVPAFREPYDAGAFGLLSAGALSLWFRRRAPVAVAWFVATLTALLVLAVAVWPGTVPQGQLALESPLLPSAAPFAAYGVTAFAGGRGLAWLPLAVTAAVACAGGPRSLAGVGQALTLVGGPAVLGLYVAARAERAERAQRTRAEQARRQERLRLAAEIHDVVSHRVSVMVLQAGALHLTAADDASRRAAGELRETGCRALDELRDLVGLLSASGMAEPASAGPPAPLPDLSTLVETSASVGIAVEVCQAGEAYPLPPAVGRTAYRIVQEALTNVRKHAPGSNARVELRYLPTEVRLSIHNTAPTRPGDTNLASAGGGAGLLGLRRRIELINGTLRAMPCADGGFQVDASLPAVAAATGEGP